MPILNGRFDYPAGLVEDLHALVNTKIINAADKAKELGNPNVMNFILLGALIKSMGLEEIA
ncbi:hypothetical protein SAMN05446037_103412 [Anaerovirgula multivorans]|uniref:Uncharacterized protein n=1 Tax=Anaerovirgula multivorans TaxID=312168 RepID=A0A239J9C6_9FIRM|nr:hypothetical protein SAMN05446037_103412 [Anaerovirgula multivorans]